MAYTLERLILPDILRLEYQRTPSLGNKAAYGSRICITGGRDYKNRRAVFDALNQQHRLGPGITEIGFGCARGADAFALEWAQENDITYKRYVADWDSIGDQAGSIRNIVMLTDFRPDKLFVFPGSVGTNHCTRAARKMKIEREFFDVEVDPLAAAGSWG